MIKKLLALLVALLMVFALVPTTGYAKTEKTENIEKTEVPEPEKTTLTECIASWGFEIDPIEDGWAYIDADGDYYNWFWFSNDSWGEPYAYEGDYYMSSASYSINFTVFPDNWLISPVIDIPDGTTTVSFYAAGTGENSCAEHFAAYICVGDSVSPSNYTTQIIPETVATADYVQYSADVSAYSGESVRIAIRHFDCSMENWFRVDLFEVYNEYEPTLIDEVELIDFIVPVWGEHPDYGVTVPDDAHCSVSWRTWYWRYPYNNEFGVIYEDDIFDNADVRYYELVDLEPDPRYEFAPEDEITVHVNGSDDLVHLVVVVWTGHLRVFIGLCAVTEPVLGDLNGNYAVEATDALLALRHAMHIITLTDDQLALGDVTGDGNVDMTDALFILRYAMHIIQQFPVEN